MNKSPPEPASDVVIWRYMDDWKFEELLSKFDDHRKWDDNPKTMYVKRPGQLWFSYPASLMTATTSGGEGTFPDSNANSTSFCDRMAKMLDLPDAEAQAKKERFLNDYADILNDGIYSMAQICGASCWRSDSSESSEAWDWFVANDHGVAVKTTVGRLKYGLQTGINWIYQMSLPTPITVEYIDFRKDFLQFDGYRWLLGAVGATWSYENEIRFVSKGPVFSKVRFNVTKPGLDNILSEEERKSHLKRIPDDAFAIREKLRKNNNKGFFVPVNLYDLIDQIVLSPESNDSYEKDVKSLLLRAGLNEIDVVRSGSIE